MLAFTRPDQPPDFDENETRWLDEVTARRTAGKTGEDLFVPHWRKYKSEMARHALVAKCAYCEVVRSLGRELDVEHIRPKASVALWISEASDESALLYPAKVFDTRERKYIEQKPREDPRTVGSGYGWLAYRWSNYLLACKDCNSGWKRSFFPLRDTSKRWSSKLDESRVESHLLLDPTQADFEATKHFAWLDDGIVTPRTDEARATIITCGLNRELLKIERLRTLQSLKAWIETLIEALETDREAPARTAYRMLSALTAVSAPFTSMARAFVEREWTERALDIHSPWA
jgi:hypothetical protein